MQNLYGMLLWQWSYVLSVFWQIQSLMRSSYFYIIFLFFFLFLASCNNQKEQLSGSGSGYDLYIKHACNTCHSLDGSRMVGPSFNGVYGKKIEFNDGRSLIVDDEYLRKAIIDPSIEIVKGYPNLMGSYKSVLSKDDINILIGFIKKQ